MIKCKSKNNCKVVSKTGKALSKSGLSRKQAEKRLAQVERFKHMKK